MFNVSSCLRSSACAALLIFGCVPAPTEAVSTKSLLAGVVGLSALGASQAGPILGWLAGATVRVIGYGSLAGAATGAALATGGVAMGVGGVFAGGFITGATTGGVAGVTALVATETANVVCASTVLAETFTGIGYLSAIGGTITSVLASVEGAAISLQAVVTLLPTP